MKSPKSDSRLLRREDACMTHRPPLGTQGGQLKALPEGRNWGSLEDPPPPRLLNTMFHPSVGTCLVACGALLANSSAQVQLTDVAAASGVADASFGRGAAMADFDQNGLLDLVAINAGQPNQYYRQVAPGAFLESSTLWGLTPDARQHWAGVVADFDNDGDEDVYVATGGFLFAESNQLLRNDLSTVGLMTDISAQSVDGSIMSQVFGATTADFDNDGDLDLFLSTTSSTASCLLLANQGGGVFFNISTGAGITEQDMFLHCSSGDFDNDGWADVAVGSLFNDNLLYRNEGTGGFKDVAGPMGVASTGDNFGMQLEDFDNDGFLDIFLPKYNNFTPATHKSEVFLNDGNSAFLDVSLGMNLTAQTDMGHNTGDIDGDGYPDLYIGTGNPAFKSLDLLYLIQPDGKGGLTANNVSTTSGIQSGGDTRCHGMAFGDFDGDGMMDIFVNNGGPSGDPASAETHYLLKGQPNGSHWASFELEGVRSNRSGVGAHLVATTSAGREVHRRRRAGTGFGNSDSPIQHVGIGADATIERLEIHWPSGITQTLINPSLSQLHQVTETGIQLTAPTFVGGTLELDLTGPSGQVVDLFASVQTFYLALPGLGELALLPPFIPIGSATLDSAGLSSVSLPIPNDPALTGLNAATQALFHDAGSLTNMSLSNGVQVQLQ